MKFNSGEVAQYLRENPQFFDEHADALADIYVSHPHGGRAISISERQIVTLRNKNLALQEELRGLLKLGRENDAMNEKMHHLAIALFTSTDIKNLLYGLNLSLCKDFSMSHAVLRLWNLAGCTTNLPEFISTDSAIHIVTENLPCPYCGPNLTKEIMDWFGEEAALLHSFAMIPLRAEKTIGLLVLGDKEPRRFYLEMGTLYLKRLGDLISAAIMRHMLIE
ncbi:MAG: DUF484 family protein [Nitrosospira sp.]|nr:DUF484 family protein [Nitrosospira sp.]MDW7653383.1 DUF484 family protein [Nitrosomonadaceae bacterium]MBI0415092.1 DUF484 family protein [Nitrosospira sp.]MBI0415460.1 DUF484 family protein [Nitrosospira sp.]MBI0416577.1 DUF484 family protein [Nitrosospira sp.]